MSQGWPGGGSGSGWDDAGPSQGYPSDPGQRYAPIDWDASGWGPPPPPPSAPPRRRRWLVPIVAAALGLAMLARVLAGQGTATESSDNAVPNGAAPATGEGYAFLDSLPDGSPVTFSSCQAIHYVVRPDNAPPDGPRMLEQSIAAVSQATGLQFVNDGLTDEAPDLERAAQIPTRYGKGPAPVLMAWSTPSEVSDLAGDVAGVGGPTTLTVTGEDPIFVTGFVYLDADGVAEAQRNEGFEGGRSIVMHELGHLVGLDHVDRRDQLMYPEMIPSITTYQSGDRAGLTLLGQGPCVRE
jgi:hypothetical protein